MNILYLNDGTTVEIPERRLVKFLSMLTHRGIKSVRFDDTIVVVSPSNLVKLELGVEDGEDTERETVEPVPVQEVPAEREEGTGDPEDTREVEPVTEEKPESPQARNDRLLEEMKEKSDCAGNKHAGKEQVIHYQDVMIKRKGKGSLPSRRYFPVCSFCGLRQKYVKADTLTDEQKENAKLYEV
jgi:hypothetical protein